VSTPAAAKAKGRSSSAPLKEQIVQNLKAAGKTGVTVKDLAAKLGKSYGNISVWFHTTAKGINQIKKVEPGRFSWAS
jgi:transposase